MHSISSNLMLLSVLPITSSLLSKCKSKETFQITSVLTQNSLSLETVMECFVYDGELLKSGLGMGSLQCTDNFCNKPRTFCLGNVIRCLLYSVHTVWISSRDVIIFVDNLSKYVHVILSCSSKVEPFPPLVSFLAPFFLVSLLWAETPSHFSLIHIKKAVQSLFQALIEPTTLFLLLKYVINHNSWIII